MRAAGVGVPAILLCATFAAIGCGGGDDGGDDDDLLPPPADGEGFQVGMTTSIGAGVEAEHCRFVRSPAEEVWVSGNEVRFTAGSHHVLLYETPYTSIPTRRDDGVEVDTSGVFDCSDGATNGWQVTKLIGGSQNASGDSLLQFPPGVAMRVRPGAVLLINAHYVNASDLPLEPEVRLNLHTLPAADVVEEGDILFLYNPLIAVPGRSTSRARWRCPVHRDITIANVQSHMHARGVGYTAAIDDGAPFYVNDRWESVPVAQFEPGLQVRAGSVLDYACDYRNDESRDVFQGPRSTDEMCMLIGSYYPADAATAACRDSDGNLAGEWIGDGTATCAQTLACIEAGLEGPGAMEAITRCMQAAAPAVAAPTSAVVNCLFAADDPRACAAPMDACRTL
jgi:hypothetical protein